MKKTTIEDLYFGKIYPCERDMSKNKSYKAALAQLRSARQTLEENMDEIQKAMLENYSIKYGEVIEQIEVSSFTEGFSLGILLLSEAIYKDTDGKNGIQSSDG